jgi:hypothetical protein
MWGARGPFLPAAAMAVAVVMPVVFCAKATEKYNKITKISCMLEIILFITVSCKTYCNSFIANCCWVRHRYYLAGITKLGEQVAKNTKLE